MKKTFKRLLILLLSAVMVGCVAALAACTDDPYKEEKGKIVISVTYPDGKPVNGPSDGSDADGARAVTVQWCIMVNGQLQSCCNKPAALDENGKVKLDIEDNIVKELGGRNNVTDDTEIEFHILYLEDKGYKSDGDYGTFAIKSLPTKLDITLKAN